MVTCVTKFKRGDGEGWIKGEQAERCDDAGVGKKQNESGT
jgi:hypothetical protein